MSSPAPASTVSIKQEPEDLLIQEPEDHMDTNQSVESSQVKSSPASTVSIKLEPEYHLKQEPEDHTDSNQSVESSLQAKIHSPAPASTVCPERPAGRGKRQRRLPQHLQDFDLDQSVVFSLQVKRSSPVTHKTASMKEEAETHKIVLIKDGAEFEYEVEDDLDLDVSTAQLPMKKPTFCDQCGKTFTTPQSLNIHQRTHTGEKPYPCDQCGKRFSVKYYLTTHQRTQTGEKPYHCDQCGKSFTISTTLRIHQRMHTVEKPHQCDQCSKRYRRSAELKRHYQIHTAETNFHCKCGDKFRTRNLLKRHAKFRCYDLPVGLLTDRLVNSVHGYKIHGNI